MRRGNSWTPLKGNKDQGWIPPGFHVRVTSTNLVASYPAYYHQAACPLEGWASSETLEAWACLEVAEILQCANKIIKQFNTLVQLLLDNELGSSFIQQFWHRPGGGIKGGGPAGGTPAFMSGAPPLGPVPLIGGIPKLPRGPAWFGGICNKGASEISRFSSLWEALINTSVADLFKARTHTKWASTHQRRWICLLLLIVVCLKKTMQQPWPLSATSKTGRMCKQQDAWYFQCVHPNDFWVCSGYCMLLRELRWLMNEQGPMTRG